MENQQKLTLKKNRTAWSKTWWRFRIVKWPWNGWRLQFRLYKGKWLNFVWQYNAFKNYLKLFYFEIR